MSGGQDAAKVTITWHDTDGAEIVADSHSFPRPAGAAYFSTSIELPEPHRPSDAAKPDL
jgi:hypothetical protein